jgi:acetaldehyde dehydrogenase / alcohol dehydrogenase
VSARVDAGRKVVEVPRPAGVVLALTPSTNPVATVFFNVLLSLMTRNAVVVCPHPLAKDVCSRAARVLAEAAEAAGAPKGCVQWVEAPSLATLEAMMVDPRVDLVLATGGTAVVQAASRSGNPSLGVGPGNVPVYVDASADVAAAARDIVVSKAFDNSVLCTNESVLIVHEAVEKAMLTRLQCEGAHLLSPDEVGRLRQAMFPMGRLDTAVIGRPAHEVATLAGVTVPRRTTVLLAPFDAVVPEEAMAHEKLCPVLGMVTVASARAGIEAARAVLRISGAGHSAAVHARDGDVVLAFGSAVPVLRVSVNVGNSLGASGFETHLPPSMTIGTGAFGGSGLAANLQPSHLMQLTTLAWNADAAVAMPAIHPQQAWQPPSGAVPAYPHASNDPASNGAPRLSDDTEQQLRDLIRRLVAEELQALVES